MTTSDYLTGARPVVGTLGACGLMLLACSWFVLGPGDLGKSREVGVPAPMSGIDRRRNAVKSRMSAAVCRAAIP